MPRPVLPSFNGIVYFVGGVITGPGSPGLGEPGGEMPPVVVAAQKRLALVEALSAFSPGLLGERL